MSDLDWYNDLVLSVKGQSQDNGLTDCPGLCHSFRDIQKVIMMETVEI